MKITFIIWILILTSLGNLSLSNTFCSPDSSLAALSTQEFDVLEISPFLEGVNGMTMDNNGVLYYSDTYSRADDMSRVYILHPPYTGTPIATEIKGFSISGLEWQNDRLFVAYLNTNEIIVYDNELEFLESRTINSPVNFASDNTNIYVLSYYGEVGMITNNKVKIYLEDLNYPFDILYSGKESLWVSEKGKNGSPGKVSEIAYEGVIINKIDTDFKEPAGLGKDHYGNIYVADKGDGKVFMVTPEGVTKLVTDSYSEPICILTMPDGRMMVNTNHNGGTLLIISPIR